MFHFTVQIKQSRTTVCLGMISDNLTPDYEHIRQLQYHQKHRNLNKSHVINQQIKVSMNIDNLMMIQK